MKAGIKLVLSLSAMALLASCANLVIPGDTKAPEEIQRVVISGIRHIEKELYQCKSSALEVRNTRLVSMFGYERIEEWDVSDCAGEEHTYVIAYQSAATISYVFHERTGKNGETSSSMLWSGGGLIRNDSITMETINAFDQEVDAARVRVLNESPETEAMLQKGKGEQYKGKHWLTLCESPVLQFKAMRIGNAVKGLNKLPGKPFSVTRCYQWYGTRADWKEKILSKKLAPSAQ